MPVRRAARVLLCAAAAAVGGNRLAPSFAEGVRPAPLPAPAKAPADSQSIAAEPTGGSVRRSEGRDPNPKGFFRALIASEAEKNGLPPDIADAVTAVESGYDPAAIGGAGEIGLMQVRPETALMLGFKGSLTELAVPEVNIHYGVTYLSEAWRLAGGDLCRALMKYRAGHGEEVMSALSVSYCLKARAHLAAEGSPYAARVLVPAIAGGPLPQAAKGRHKLPPIRTAAISRSFWTAEEARVRAITARVKARWRRLASRQG